MASIKQRSDLHPHAIDAHAVHILEYAKVKALLAGYAACSLGRRAIKQLLPMTAFEAVRTAVAETTELRGLLQRRGRLPVAGMSDVRPLLGAAEAAPPDPPAVSQPAGGSASDEYVRIIEPSGLRDLRNTLLAAHECRLVFEDEAAGCPHLARLAERLDDFTPLCAAIDAVIANDGTVLDDASPALLVIRRRLEAAATRLREQAHALVRSAHLRPFLQDDTVAQRQGHYVLAVRVECKHQVDGIVHDRSQSGATVFVEPRALILLANEMEDLRFEEQREVSRLLRELTMAVRAEREAILRTLDTLAHVDLTYAKARFSLDYAMAPPAINDQGRLDVRRARHPILIQVLERSPHRKGQGSAPVSPLHPRDWRSESPGPSASSQSAIGNRQSAMAPQVVPIDYRLGEEFDLLIVTGPNTGGKTVALKTIGLLALMAQSGLHVPADGGSAFPVYEDVLADIGDEQSIEQSLSTFSSHMTNLVRILARAERRTLVLLDELGAGTDPLEGAALATAILDHLAARSAKTVVTTHIGELKAYAYRHPRAMNAACEFDEATLRPTYRLLMGQPGSSNAVAIAERLGLPRPLVQKARSIVQQRQGKDADLLAELQRIRGTIEQDRELAHQKLQEAERLRAELDAKVRAAERTAQASRREAEHEIDEQAHRLRDRALDALRQLHNAPAPFADRARTVEAVLQEEVARTPLAAKRLEFARSLKRDDLVHVVPFGETCRVRAVNRTKERLQVVLGHSVVEVSFDDVTWVEPPKK